jgi:pimeloyl-ACP methyl ester carboxylesterase
VRATFTIENGSNVPELTITSADGTKLATRRSGRGSPLVLVHGAIGDLDTFALVEGALAERHTVWVYSRRGRGGSTDSSDYALQREIDDVLAVLAATGDRAHLVGHSGGALYCLLAAMDTRSLRSLVLYEPPLRLLNFDDFDQTVIDDVQSAIDAGDADWALELFFPVAGIVEQEIQALRSLDQVWKRLQAGVPLVPREFKAGLEDARERFAAFEPPDVPTLYLYGQDTQASIFPTLDQVAELLPNAQPRCLAGQRHLAFAFDPTTFARAILDFTTSRDE